MHESGPSKKRPGAEALNKLYELGKKMGRMRARLRASHPIAQAIDKMWENPPPTPSPAPSSPVELTSTPEPTPPEQADQSQAQDDQAASSQGPSD